MIVKPVDVYNKLLSEDNILSKNGQIKFSLSDVDIIVKQKDVVGNIIQEWLHGWLKTKGIDFSLCSNPQMPPDFFLNPTDKTQDLLEVKAFYYKASPCFDIADFKMYSDEIVKKPYVLDTDYLVFGYDMSHEGIVTIKKIWLQKVWEMIRPMAKWPLNLQIKKNVVHKIRPGKWYSSRSRKFKFFASKEDFVAAVEETVYKNKDTRDNAADWKDRFLASYEHFYGRPVVIPRWCDIKSKYVL
jgi:type II restriction enzyme